jgi:hypothetical protein
MWLILSNIAWLQMVNDHVLLQRKCTEGFLTEYDQGRDVEGGISR